MPAYNFQERFVPMIEDGSKHHTIRPRRKRPTKAGDALRLLTGQRTKACRLVRQTVCTAVVPVKIYPELLRIVLGNRTLSLQDVTRFTIRDGFTNPAEFFEFFRRYPATVLENMLEVIYWR